MEEAKEKPVLQDEDGDGAEDDAAVVATGTAASSPPSWWFFTDAHPCSLLQYAVRACAGCLLRLCGGSGDDDDQRPGAVADASDGDPADASSQRNAEGGGRANLRDLVCSQLLVARRRPPAGSPGGPRPGRGGSHN
ncbi:hypothetical protein EJB05_09442 [Eragrostis curvula]|uniref:Uncharacterized protein n=1 Tax=Eragrostis curvula TaxID=38414 RepID=A0A5J9W2Q3_9POAL|nr:hypothetical protein EJB05_09442 [Eragrostis curvula]